MNSQEAFSAKEEVLSSANCNNVKDTFAETWAKLANEADLSTSSLDPTDSVLLPLVSDPATRAQPTHFSKSTDASATRMSDRVRRRTRKKKFKGKGGLEGISDEQMNYFLPNYIYKQVQKLQQIMPYLGF